MSNVFRRIPTSRGGVSLATGLIALTVLGLLTAVVVRNRGNLAWDDADYLRRGLADARVAKSAGWLMVVPRAVDCLLREHPKPSGLVAWIQLGALVVDRRGLDGLIVYASVVPYGFLLLVVVSLGRWLAGAWGGLLALVCLVSSPYSLAFGGKVMVETFLSLWVLLTYVLTCRLLERPSRKRGAAVGLVAGLAFLTKLTTVLFLPAPLLFALVRVARGGPDRRILIKSLAWSGVVCTAVAGPWYAGNAIRAVKFAQLSAKYNEIVEGRPDRIASTQRLTLMTADLAGWPMAATLTCASLYVAVPAWRQRSCGPPAPAGSTPSHFQVRFSRMAWLGAGAAAVVLLYPRYFDTRFLLPIWPVLAVDLGARLSAAMPRFHPVPRVILAGGLAAAVVSAGWTVARTPPITTYWNTAAVIDHLVRDFGISTLGNVGNCAEWNVCKTGLINELRDEPANCFVLHDLTKLNPDSALRHLGLFDAVVVLGWIHLPDRVFQQVPGLNRSYGTLTKALAADPTLLCVTVPRCRGVPELSVYIRQGSRVLVDQLSTQTHRKRRL